MAEGFQEHTCIPPGPAADKERGQKSHGFGNPNDGRANAGNEKHTPGPEAETVSQVPRITREPEFRTSASDEQIT